ncbi:MAG: RNA methyltransferase [Bacteroidetes bacterium]|nr:RNA methyltransferase [Bacteroidota bacterium]
MKSISSIQNPWIKHLLVLQEKSRVRKKEKLFVFEGLNEIRLCLKAGYNLRSLIFCETIYPYSRFCNEIQVPGPETEVIATTPEIFNKLAYRADVVNAIAVAEMPEHSLLQLQRVKNPVYLVVESVEKPGNLGALLRTADAAGIDAVLVCNPATDLYNPNTIRSSVGCVFTVPVAVGSTEEIQSFLEECSCVVFTTIMENAGSVWEMDFTGAAALVVGTENSGLSDAWKNPAYTNVNIPMFGAVDSLNVSIAASLLMYEARRQRQVRGLK